MAGGLSMSEFLDWSINTGPTFLSGERSIINDVSRRSFMLGKFLRGKPASETVQGGTTIRETLYLTPNRNFTTFKRNEDIVWENPQKDQIVQYPWRFTLGHQTWDEAEYLLQTGGVSGQALKVKYKDMKFSKDQRLWEDLVDGWESLLWQSPNGMASEMEVATGQEPYSIPVFVNEAPFTGWTTVGGLNPTTFPAWDNKRGTYAKADFADPVDGIFPAFDRMSLDIGYERPGFKDEFFESDTALGSSTIIGTSKYGMATIMRLHRAANDMLIQAQDAAYPLPRWNGIPLKDVQALDAAALYPGDSSTFVGEQAGTVTHAGPRYYFLNCKYLKTVFHGEKYFQMGERKNPENKVGVSIVPVESWGNMVCTSRRRQGIVSPATASST